MNFLKERLGRFLNALLVQIRNIIIFFALLGGLIAIGYSAIVQANHTKTTTEMSAVAIEPPVFRPKPGQASIDRAIAMFGIEVPAVAHYPQFDATIEDRGRTIRSVSDKKANVIIGSAAFESWAILGSTLAHELEVHCQQSFLMIQILDMVGLQGTHIAERQAYNYEIDNAKRFGLRDYEVSNINETKYYYYSSKSNHGIQERIDIFAEKILFKN